MSGKIEKIVVYPAKGTSGTELTEARLVENSGLEGDFHADGSDRQLSILFAESREAAGIHGEGLCLKRFKENLSIRGLVSPDVKPGTRLSAGDTVLEITCEVKHCHEECTLYQEGKRCSLSGLNLFARVVKSGIICVGYSVQVM